MDTKAVVTINRWRRAPAFAVVGAVLMLLTGCATTTRYRNALHPEYGQTEFDRDWYECRRENMRPKVSGYALPNVSGYDAGMTVHEDMVRYCLAARGWRPITSTTAQSSPAPASARPNAALAPASGTFMRPEVVLELAYTERLQRSAALTLTKPYLQTPFACNDEGWYVERSYVVEVAPWAEAAGLRKGDRLVAFGDVTLAIHGSAAEAWSMVPRGTHVTVSVDRGGQETTIQLPCRDGPREAWQAEVATLRAIAEGQWQTCVDAVRTAIANTRMTPAAWLDRAATCMRERAKALSQSPSDEYWRTFHASATKAIEESRYKPTGLTEIRSGLLHAADVLEKAGRSSWANDIRQQIATFETSSRP